MPLFVYPLRSGALPQKGDKVRSRKGPSQQKGDGSGAWLTNMSGEMVGAWSRSQVWKRKIAELTLNRLFIQEKDSIIL